ncbi:MAG TPA: hypothetical protein VFD10_06750 [Atribacterota bacterium]|nr:hypothetical protein [Atribacterota bacterium]
MNKREIISTTIVIIIGLMLLNCIIWLYNLAFPSTEVIHHLNKNIYYYLAVISSLFFLLGILMEWKSVLAILSNKIEINKFLLIVSILLLFVSLIPVAKWYIWFNFNLISLGWFIDVFKNEYTRNIIPIIAGIIFIRSFANSN